VSINGINSDPLPVDYGVIQGSCLGPILFLIYINNLSKLNIVGKPFLFADDTLLLVRGESWQHVYEIANNDLKLLKKWFDQNVLSVNFSKTKFMPISLSIQSDYNLQNLIVHECIDPNTPCMCQGIEKVLSYKYLGIIFDYRMRWIDHLDFLKNKLRKYVYAFRQLSEVLTVAEIKLTYYAYVQSLLIFGVISWGGAYKTHLESLDIVQKTILKVALRKNKLYPSEALYEETGIFTIRQLFVKNILIHIYKNSDTIFTKISHVHNTRYSQNVGVVPLKLVKSYSTTNPYYISHIIYINFIVQFGDENLFNAISVPTFKKRANDFLHRIGRQAADELMTASYRRA